MTDTQQKHQTLDEELLAEGFRRITTQDIRALEDTIGPLADLIKEHKEVRIIPYYLTRRGYPDFKETADTKYMHSVYVKP